jgi:hypothetical protein
LAARIPDLPPTQRDTAAAVATQIFAALLGTVVTAPAPDRDRWITELNKALVGYLAPLES